MPPRLNVYGLPSQVTPDELIGGTAVVIDVLRASTTIVHALEAGAREIIPCLEVEEARARAAEFPREEVVLAGERQGLPIEGFDLGNSPTEYTRDRVEGKTVVFTTTNGTRAMSRCRSAERVLIGAFVNASAVCEGLGGREQVHLLCAGRRGQYGPDDGLLAGLLVDRLQQQRNGGYELNGQAVAAREEWRGFLASPLEGGDGPLDPESLAAKLQLSAAGRHLAATGQLGDILTAAQIDRFGSVPELDPKTFRIRLH